MVVTIKECFSLNMLRPMNRNTSQTDRPMMVSEFAARKEVLPPRQLESDMEVKLGQVTMILSLQLKKSMVVAIIWSMIAKNLAGIMICLLSSIELYKLYKIIQIIKFYTWLIYYFFDWPNISYTVGRFYCNITTSNYSFIIRFSPSSILYCNSSTFSQSRSQCCLKTYQFLWIRYGIYLYRILAIVLAPIVHLCLVSWTCGLKGYNNHSKPHSTYICEPWVKRGVTLTLVVSQRRCLLMEVMICFKWTWRQDYWSLSCCGEVPSSNFYNTCIIIIMSYTSFQAVNPKHQQKIQKHLSKFVDVRSPVWLINSGSFEKIEFQKISPKIWGYKINSLIINNNLRSNLLKQLNGGYFQCLLVLGLSNNSILSVQPLLLINAPYLQALYLDKNLLNSLRTLRKFADINLKILDVSSNYIKSLEYLSEFNCPNLQQLILTRNDKISGLQQLYRSGLCPVYLSLNKLGLITKSAIIKKYLQTNYCKKGMDNFKCLI